MAGLGVDNPKDGGWNASGTDAIALLHDLTCWREQLARSVARNNPELRSDHITAAVNRILFPLLLLRIAQDRHLIEAGTLVDLRNLPAMPCIMQELVPYADALYKDDFPVSPHSPDPGNDFLVEDRVIHTILAALLSLETRYDFRKMPTGAIAQVLMQYLTRTIRRSATQQATVVDTHDTVVSGGSVIPPLPLIDYMVKQAMISAWKNRSTREILPLRVIDTACGSGTVLLALYRHILENAGGSTLTFEERREHLVHSIYGLDINRHAVAATRMLLFLELCNCPQVCLARKDFSVTAQSVFQDLRHTILCGNALVGPEIVEDESWMFCPARDRHTLNPFSYKERFPEIAAGGGFDAVVCNPPEGALEQREWLQQYFQQRYAVYHPLVDRSAYFLEKSLSLVSQGGTVSCIMSNAWLRGSNGSPLREMLNTRQVEEIVDLAAIPSGKPGAGLCLLRVSTSPPSRTFPAVLASTVFLEDPYSFVRSHKFPVDPRLLDKGGWALRDTRAEEIIRKVSRHSTPLEEFVMGQVHTGIRIPKDDPFVIDEAQVREWLQRDSRCKPLLRRLYSATEINRYYAGAGKKIMILIPQGWTISHPPAAKKPWQWFKHRHPHIGRHLQQFEGMLKTRAGPDSLWWETAWDVFWQEPRKKILFPERFSRPVFFFDTGRGIGDEATNAIPSAGLYLAGILNSRLLAFVFDHSIRQSATNRKLFTWDDLKRLPIYTPDIDRPEDLARHDRMEVLVRKMSDLEKNSRAARNDLERERLLKKIRATDRQIDELVYDIYGLTADEIAVVEDTIVK